MEKVISKLATLIKRQGVFSFFSNLAEYIKWRYRRYKERRFDERYAIDTLQTNLSYFDSAQSSNTEYAVPYEPVQYHVFRKMLDNTSINPADYAFIDLGSGKGRALIFASDFPFKEIIGVEFSQELHEIAGNNLHNYLTKTGKKNNFKLICMDVVDYDFPKTDLVIFLYNPFFGKVMDAVLDKITHFLLKQKFDLVILYRNPQCAEFFESHELLRTLYSDQSFSIYRRKQ